MTLEEAESYRAIAAEAVRASIDLLRGAPSAEPVSAIGRDMKLREDSASEALIIAALRQKCDLPILAEESGWVDGRVAAEEAPYWALDPLDGSYNRFCGVPLNCVALALCVGFRPIAGAVFDFNRDELFSGGPGLGLTLNGRPVAPPARATGIMATGLPVRGDFSPEGLARMAREFQSWKKVRMIGSAALSLSWVAAGRFDAYREAGISWWDVAAGLALVSAVGGEVVVTGARPEDPLTIAATSPAASGGFRAIG
jgi:myo-inositol-1(or 4)-monophosphatase